MTKGELLYSGKAKSLYKTQTSEELHVVYEDQATALNGLKKETIFGKGRLNNQISALVFEYLENKGISTHYVKKISETEMIVKKADMLPVEVVLRNYATGSFIQRFGTEEGLELNPPILEFYYKNDDLNDPFMNDDHIQFLKIASAEELKEIRLLTFKVNRLLTELFEKAGLLLVDYKLEFGRTAAGQLVLADEFSPDNCRLWDKETRKSLDKDIFRKNQGDIVPIYQEVLNRLNEALNN